MHTFVDRKRSAEEAKRNKMSALQKNLRSFNQLSQIGLISMGFHRFNHRAEQGVQKLNALDYFSGQTAAGYLRRASQNYRATSSNPVSRYAGPIRRNNILTAQSAARRRQYIDYDEMYMARMGKMDRKVRNESGKSVKKILTTGQKESDFEEKHENPPRGDSSVTNEDRQMTGDDTDVEVQSIRETIFGKQDDDDANNLGSMCDNDLLKRVTAQHGEAKDNTLSNKVSVPYTSYNNHRNRWAEFRHNMIYGRSSF